MTCASRHALTPAQQCKSACPAVPARVVQVLTIPDAVFAHLMQQRTATEARADFTTFCVEHPKHANWRHEQAAFGGNAQVLR